MIKRLWQHKLWTALWWSNVRAAERRRDCEGFRILEKYALGQVMRDKNVSFFTFNEIKNNQYIYAVSHCLDFWNPIQCELKPHKERSRLHFVTRSRCMLFQYLFIFRSWPERLIPRILDIFCSSDLLPNEFGSPEETLLFYFCLFFFFRMTMSNNQNSFTAATHYDDDHPHHHHPNLPIFGLFSLSHGSRAGEEVLALVEDQWD